MLAACIYQQHCANRRAGLTWAQWLPVSWAALKTACHPRILWEHGRLALAGGIMNAAEAGAFDVTTAFAGKAAALYHVTIHLLRLHTAHNATAA
jgi:hypothetical protein